MINRFLRQSWGLLLIFAIWQICSMLTNYNSIVMVSPAAVLLDVGFNPMSYAMPALGHSLLL